MIRKSLKINQMTESNENIVLNEDGERVDSSRRKASMKAARTRERRAESGIYDKFEEGNALSKRNEPVDACECAGASFSSAISGAQTCAALGEFDIITIDDIKEFLNGK